MFTMIVKGIELTQLAYFSCRVFDAVKISERNNQTYSITHLSHGEVLHIGWYFAKDTAVISICLSASKITLVKIILGLIYLIAFCSR